MEFLPVNPILEFNSDTLQAVRKFNGFDNAQEVTNAINTLNDWVQKQNHFIKKDFSKEYLERTIIASKGSVERAKIRLDKICTFRTLLPHFFGEYDIRTDFKNLKVYTQTPLPKLTKENERVFLSRCVGNEFSSSLVLDGYRFTVMILEYLRAQDYVNRYISVVDLMSCDLMKLLSAVNIAQISELSSISREGYGSRIKAIHILTSSKFVDSVVSLLKQLHSSKVGERIQVHKTIETLYEFVPKDILPAEYGGKERSINKLYDDWIDVISSKEFLEYRKEMNKACTNESLRQTDKFNEQYMGMPGTFRSLSVD